MGIDLNFFQSLWTCCSKRTLFNENAPNFSSGGVSLELFVLEGSNYFGPNSCSFKVELGYGFVLRIHIIKSRKVTTCKVGGFLIDI